MQTTQVLILADFKLNFTPEKADQIAALHERVAQRLLRLCLTNQGLYIKVIPAKFLPCFAPSIMYILLAGTSPWYASSSSSKTISKRFCEYL